MGSIMWLTKHRACLSSVLFSEMWSGTVKSERSLKWVKKGKSKTTTKNKNKQTKQSALNLLFFSYQKFISPFKKKFIFIFTCYTNSYIGLLLVFFSCLKPEQFGGVRSIWSFFCVSFKLFHLYYSFLQLISGFCHSRFCLVTLLYLLVRFFVHFVRFFLTFR